MTKGLKDYWAVIGDNCELKHFHYLKDAKKYYNKCKNKGCSAMELYRVNQKPTGTGKWIRL